MTVNNILAIYYQATTQERISGRRWYETAFHLCHDLAEQYGVEFNVVVCMVAALSPRNKWQRNIQDVDSLLKHNYYDGLDDIQSVKVATFHANRDKAIALLSGHLTVSEFLAPARTGYKVKSFARAIMGQDSRDSVVVDVHATSVWRNERVMKSSPYNLTPRRYENIQRDYELAAIKAGETPQAMQAITWVTWKRLHKI